MSRKSDVSAAAALLSGKRKLYDYKCFICGKSFKARSYAHVDDKKRFCSNRCSQENKVYGGRKPK